MNKDQKIETIQECVVFYREQIQKLVKRREEMQEEMHETITNYQQIIGDLTRDIEKNRVVLEVLSQGQMISRGTTDE